MNNLETSLLDQVALGRRALRHASKRVLDLLQWHRRNASIEGIRSYHDSATFFANHIIFHTHVEKAAGSTLVHALRLLFGPSRLYDLRDRRLPRPVAMSGDKKSEIFVLTGHFHFGTMEFYFDRHPIYIACVRDPVSRFYSYYKYVSGRPEHPGHQAMAGKSFEQVVYEYIQIQHHSMTNPMSRMLTGNRSPSVQTVIRHIDRNYFLITPQERVDEMTEFLFDLFKAEVDPPKRRRNVGDYADHPSDEASDIIRQHNFVDLTLYQHVCQNFTRMQDRARKLLGRERSVVIPRRKPLAQHEHNRYVASIKQKNQLHEAWERAARQNEGQYRLYDMGEFKIWLNVSESVMMYARSVGKYEIAKTNLIRRTLGPGDVFVDVGANKGDFTLLAASLVGASGTVLSVEPHPENVRWINASIAENGFDNIEVLQLACCDRDGMAQLGVARASGGHSLMRSGGDAIQVPSRRLDNVIAERGIERVHAIKIDVEGAERLVLDGAAEILRRHRPVVFLDVHKLSAQDNDAIADLFQSLGYRMASTRDPDVVIGRLPHGRGDYVVRPSE